MPHGTLIGPTNLTCHNGLETAHGDCIVKRDDGLEIIGVLLAVVCALLWFLPTVRAKGTNRVLTRKDYVHIAMFYGILCS